MEEKSDLEKVELGIITKPFGIKGEIVIMPFSKEPIHLVNAKKVWIEENIYDVDNSRNNLKKIIVKFKDINTKEEAEKLRGKKVFLKTNSLEKLEENKYYHYQIIGCRVIDKNIGEIGNITQIIETGSNDVYVATKNNSEHLIPASKNIILKIDIINKIILVNLPDSSSN